MHLLLLFPFLMLPAWFIGTVLLASALLATDNAAALSRRLDAHYAFFQRPRSLEAMAQVSGVRVTSATFWSSGIAVDPARFSPDGFCAYPLGRGAHLPVKESTDVPVALVETFAAAVNRPPSGIERLFAVALTDPAICAPGPCVALGTSVYDAAGSRRVPAMLYQDGLSNVYLIDAHDGLTTAFTVLLEGGPVEDN